MERSRIILGGAEISKRYIENRLVWTAGLIFKGTSNIIVQNQFPPYLTFEIPYTDKIRASKLLVSGREIRTYEISINQTVVSIKLDYNESFHQVQGYKQIELYE